VETTIESTLQSAVEALGNRDPERAIAIIEELLQGSLEPMSEMFARGLLAPALATLGRVHAGREQAERAHDLALGLGDAESAAHYLQLMRQLDVVGLSDEAIDQAFDRAGAALDAGDSATAEMELQTLLLAALAHLRADIEASARGMLAQALVLRGANAEAREQLDKALELASQIGDEGARAHFEQLQARLATSEGADGYRRDMAITRRSDEAMKHAGAAMEAGDFDLAQSLVQPITDEAEAAGMKETEATMRGMLAQIHLLAGRKKDAEREANVAIRLAEALGARDAADSFRQILQLAIGFTMPVQKA